MQIVKNKFKNIRNEHFKSIVSLKQPKNLYRELTSSRFISNFKNMRKPETYKCSDKRCKICQNDLNETIIHNVKCSQYQMVKFGKFAEKLTTTQSMSYII